MRFVIGGAVAEATAAVRPYPRSGGAVMLVMATGTLAEEANGLSPRIVAAAATLVVLAALAGLAAYDSHAFSARADQVTARLEQLRQGGVEAASIDGLTAQLRSIQKERWGPLPRAWLPGPLGGQDARLRALVAGIDRVEQAALETARADARSALEQLGAADPGLPPGELAAERAHIDGARTPAQARQLAEALRAASTVAAQQRQPALDLEPRVATLRQLMARASDLKVDTGEAAAAVAAYEALVKMPAAQVGANLTSVTTLLDRAQESLSAAVEKAERAAASPPAPAAPSQRGRIVVIDLGDQQLYAYEDGVLRVSAPVTTGRPELPTEQGTFQVILKRSPYQFISPWPRGSPYYYAPAWTNWAVEFIGDGTFLHDAPWQPDGTYGAGSQNGPYASHGCVHVPSAVMSGLYDWIQLGDTVVVQA